MIGRADVEEPDLAPSAADDDQDDPFAGDMSGDPISDAAVKADAFRLLAHQAIHALREAYERERRQKERIRRVLEETKLLRLWLRRQRRPK